MLFDDICSSVVYGHSAFLFSNSARCTSIYRQLLCESINLMNPFESHNRLMQDSERGHVTEINNPLMTSVFTRFSREPITFLESCSFFFCVHK